MSYLLIASCWICGTEHEGLRFGSGFIQKTPFVPALEKATNQLVCAAHGDDDHYRYYTDPKMYENHGEEPPIQWSDLQLSAENNYCPECEEFSMDFEVVGEGD